MRAISIQATLRQIVGPLAVAALSGIQLAQYGLGVAAVGACLVFLVSHATVVLWARYRLRRARRRLAALRLSRK